MNPVKLLIKITKTVFSDVRSTIVSLIVISIFGGGLCYTFCKNAFVVSIEILKSQTPLWASILLIGTCLVYTYVKVRQIRKNVNSNEPPKIKEELIELFGIKWNKEYQKRCLNCESPLKYSSSRYDAYTLFCSKCQNKHTLRDKHGNLITELKAIEQIKKVP
jgi:hypothetical protein